jgi:DNA-binding MarR family transcriptional regulator
LTPAGERVLEAGHPIVNEVFGASFADLSEKERSTLLDLLLRSLMRGSAASDPPAMRA